MNTSISENKNISSSEIPEIIDFENHYHTLFNSLDIGFCIIEILFDDNEKPIDYRFIETNQAFQKRELLTDIQEYWFEIYGKVALTGESTHFENTASQVDSYYDVYAYRFGKPGQNQVAVLFHDIKRQKKTEEELQKREASLEITRHKKTLNELMVSELKLKNALRLSKMGHVEIDLVTNHITWSDEIYNIYERPVEAGEPTLEEAVCYIHPDDRARVINQVQNASKDEVLEIDYRIQLPGERIKHLTYFITPVFEGDRQIKRIGTIQDITERKNMELRLKLKKEKIEILLKELYHRIKNNMQIISSLLQLRGDSISNEEDRDAFLKMKNHIQAMSMVHEKLYQSQNLSHINFGTYIKDLSESLMACYPEILNKVKVKYDLEDVEIFIDTALPCGFVITELIHNIFKHAFPGDLQGNINISLCKIDRGFELKISDDGIGIPHSSLENTNHLGLMLIKSLIVDQLNGELTLHNTKGTSWHIIIRDRLYHSNRI